MKDNKGFDIFLPKIYKGDDERFKGKPMISWSQIETWNSKSGFNTGMLGFQEYILKYFVGASFPDMGWGTFGTETEGYICEKQYADKFNDKEKEVLDAITPLGVFQQEGLIDFGEFVVLLYIDDMSPDFKKLRDYKTKSESSKKDLHKPEKHQLEIYSLWIQQEKGFLPEEIEYCVIERLGGKECMAGGGRDVLSIGERVWYEPYNITPERLEETKALIINSVREISSFYKTYLKIFGDVPEVEDTPTE